MQELKKILSRIRSILMIAFLPCTGLLLVYFLTSPIITEYYELKEKRAVLDIFEIPYQTTEMNLFGFTIKGYDEESVREAFDENITVVKASEQTPKEIEEEVPETGEKEKTEKKYYKYIKDGKLQGIGFVESKIGYGYNVSAVMTLFICVEPDLVTLKGIEVLDHSETPGLGGRMTEDEFKKQFEGLKLKPRIKMVKDGASAENEFDAITGATNTSIGVENFINDTMKEFWEQQGD